MNESAQRITENRLNQLENHLRKTGAGLGELATIVERLRQRIAGIEVALGSEAGAILRRMDRLENRLEAVETAEVQNDSVGHRDRPAA